MRILAIIPAWREEQHIGDVVAGVKKYITDVLVIDDASPDNTSAMARAAGAVVVRHPINLGYAAAVQTGYKYALNHKYQYVLQLDGDGQHNPDDIPKLLALKDTADIVIGSRFANVGNYAMPLSRKIGKSIFSFCVYLCSKQRILDVTSGFQLISQPVLRLFASDAFADEYPDADMLILALNHGHSVVETGVSMRPSATGQSMHAGIISPMYYMLRMSIGVLSAMFMKVR